MRRNWWDGMSLEGWLAQRRCLATTAADMKFAQHVARERAKVRGVRQRLTVEQPNYHRRPVLFVQDAPEPVAEPCS